MKNLKFRLLAVAGIAALTLAGCSPATTKSADVTESIRSSLDQAGYRDVKVSQDRDKGVVTLDGSVATDADKGQAESIAKSMAGTQVVANQVAVLPPGGSADARKVNSALDDGIEDNLKAAFVKQRLGDGVDYDVENQVVKLTGEVTSQAKRSQAEKIAAGVPNVTQVVNELQVKGQKATSSR